MLPHLKVLRGFPKVTFSLLAPAVIACKGVRKRPCTALFVLAVLLRAGTGAGTYLYALQQWHAAETDVKEGRLGDARDRLHVCLFVWPWSARVHLLAARVDRLSMDLQGAEAHLNRCLELQGGATEATQLEFLLLRIQWGEVDEVMPALFTYVENKHAETPLILETLAR